MIYFNYSKIIFSLQCESCSRVETCVSSSSPVVREVSKKKSQVGLSALMLYCGFSKFVRSMSQLALSFLRNELAQIKYKGKL